MANLTPYLPDAAALPDHGALRAIQDAAPSAAPQGDGFAPKPQASAFPLGAFPSGGPGSFTTGSDGNPKFAWARSGYANFGRGWAWQNSAQALQMGGRTSKDSALAAIVSNEMLTSNSSLFTLVLNLTNSVHRFRTPTQLQARLQTPWHYSRAGPAVVARCGDGVRRVGRQSRGM